MKFMIEKRLWFTISPNSNEDSTQKIMVFQARDWAGDKDTRCSGRGYVIFLMGIPIRRPKYKE